MAFPTVNSGAGTSHTIFSSSNLYGAGHCQTLFTYKNQKAEKNCDCPTYSFLDLLGNISTLKWSQMSAAEQSELLAFAYRFDENIRRKLWLEAWEQTHAEQLREKIASKQRATNDKTCTSSISILY